MAYIYTMENVLESSFLYTTRVVLWLSPHCDLHHFRPLNFRSVFSLEQHSMSRSDSEDPKDANPFPSSCTCLNDTGAKQTPENTSNVSCHCLLQAFEQNRVNGLEVVGLILRVVLCICSTDIVLIACCQSFLKGSPSYDSVFAHPWAASHQRSMYHICLWRQLAAHHRDIRRCGATSSEPAEASNTNELQSVHCSYRVPSEMFRFHQAAHVHLYEHLRAFNPKWCWNWGWLEGYQKWVVG